MIIRKIAATLLGAISVLLQVAPAAADEPAPSPALSEGGAGVQQVIPFGRQEADMLRELTTLQPASDSAGAQGEVAMTMEQTIAMALHNNSEVLAATEKHEGAKYESAGARWQYYPSVEVLADSGYEDSAPAAYNDANGNRVMDNTHLRNDWTVTVRQPLIDMGIYRDIKVSKAKEDIALAEKMDIGDGVALDAANAFLGLIQAKVGIQLANQYIEYLQKLEATMRVRVDGGAASSADLDRIRGRTMKAEAALIDAQGEYQTNAMEFRRLTTVEPRGLVVPDVLSPPTPASIADAVDQAVQNNSNYLGSLRRVDLALSERNKTMAGLLPRLSLQYSDSYSYDAGGSAQGTPVDGVYPTQYTQSLMVVLQWSMYGGNTIAGGLSGASKIREMNFRAMDMRDKLEQGVRAAYTAINAARQRGEILAKNVETNLRVAQTFDEQFLNGSRSLFDLIDAYEQLYSARLNLVRATVIGAKSVYQLHRLMGDIVPSVLAMGGK